jgi:hypothetical protein
MQMTNQPGLKALLFLGVLLGLTACNGQPEATDAPAGEVDVEAAIEEFHTLYNDQEFAALYDHAGGQFAQTTSEAEVTMFLADLRQTLGDVESFDITSQDAIAGNGVQAAAEVDTTFANDSGTEYFTFRFTDEEWQWTNYRVESPLLTEQIQEAQEE